MNSKELFANKKNCNGCGLCSALCKRRAICLRTDKQGFLYPIIDTTLCVDCKLCTNICPQKHPIRINNDMLQAYAMKHRDRQKLQYCTSGGAFIGIVEWFFQNMSQPVVYGCVLENSSRLKVVHNRCDNLSDCRRFNGSKYVQSNIIGIYEKIKDDLEKGKTVLFSGTPCQVAGVYKAFFRWKESGHLYLVDIICHAVPSPLIFSDHVSYIERKHQKKISDYKFRSKIAGWRHIETAYFVDGTFTKDRDTQRFKDLFYNDFTIRDSCADCKYYSPHRISDITIGDFWGIENVDKSFYDSQGVSFVIVHTIQGNHIIEGITTNFEMLNIPVIEGYKYNHTKPVSLNVNRNKFWADYFSHGYSYVAKKYTDGILKRNAKALVHFFLSEKVLLKIRKLFIG